MNWKHVIMYGWVVASVVALAAIPASAQPGGFGHPRSMDPEERIDRHVGFLDEELDLTDEQVEQVRGILENAQAVAEAWHKDHPDASRDDRRVFREEQRSTTDSAITQVLSEDQKAAFESLKEARGRHWGRGGPGMGFGMRRGMHGGRNMHGRAGMHGAPDMPGQFDGSGLQAGRMLRRFYRELNLSEEQRDDLAALQEDRASQMEAWQKEHADATWQDRLAFRASQFSASIAAIGDILTPEQNEKLDELLARRGQHRRFGEKRGSAMLFHRLNLSEEQQNQLKKLREEHQAAASAWHEANPNATVKERRAFRDAQRKKMKEELESVLTEEQLSKFKSLRARHDWGPKFGPPAEDADDIE